MFIRSLTSIVTGQFLGNFGMSNITKTVSITAHNFVNMSTNIGASDAVQEKFVLPERYGSQGESVWVEYAALAAKYKPINLGQGFPDFAAPSFVTEALGDVAKDENVLLHQYTRGFGHPRLINALSTLYSRLTNVQLDPISQILVTCGAYEALYCAICGHVDKGDEVIIIEPYFDCYEPMVLSAGGVPKFIALKPKGDASDAGNWVLDDSELEALFSNKTKMIILNTPHNPLGKVFKKAELEKIAVLCKKFNVLCISDEVYEWMVYPGHEHIRICTLPGMWERTISIGSAGKTFSVTGWKTGWAYGPKNLMKNLFIVHQNCIYTHCTPIQESVARAFEKVIPKEGESFEKSQFTELAIELLPKRSMMEKFLKDIGMKPVVPEGGYFMMADWTNLASKVDLSKEEDTYKDYKFTKWMTKNVGVQGIPPSAFYSKEHKHLGEDYIRLCFIKEDENLQKAADVLHKWKTSKL